jgi:hypothetical protein
MLFWAVFMSPAQGFFNALIYFYSPMKQPRRSTVEPLSGASDDPQRFRQWGSFQSSFTRRRSSESNIPSAAAAAIQEKESQELNEDEPVEDLATIPETSIEEQ